MAIRTACEVCSQMMKQSPKLVWKYLMIPMLRPLVVCFKPTQDTSSGLDDKTKPTGQELVASESQVERCFMDAHAVIVTNRPSAFLLKFFSQLLPALFSGYCFATSSKSYLSSMTKDIIISFFKQVDPGRAAKELIRFVLPLPSRDPHMVFCPGGTGGIALKNDPASVR